MIPIRNFPYSDYHDLNLDWLLRRIFQFEVDLEDLKRRVRRLEDWREEAEPVITDLVSRMLIVEGNITIINNRLTTVEGDIVDIRGDIVDIKNDIRTIINNSTSFYFYENDINTVRCDYLGGTTFTMDATSIVDFVHKIKGDPAPSKGGLNYNVYVISATRIVREAEIMINSTSDTDIRIQIVSRDITNTDDHRLTRIRYAKISYQLVYDNYSSSFDYYFGYPVIKYSNVEIPASGWVSNDDPTYTYKNVISLNALTPNCEARAYFRSLSDHEAYSDILSDYVEVYEDIPNGTKLIFYANDLIFDDFNLDIFIDC